MKLSPNGQNCHSRLPVIPAKAEIQWPTVILSEAKNLWIPAFPPKADPPLAGAMGMTEILFGDSPIVYMRVADIF